MKPGKYFYKIIFILNLIFIFEIKADAVKNVWIDPKSIENVQISYYSITDQLKSSVCSFPVVPLNISGIGVSFIYADKKVISMGIIESSGKEWSQKRISSTFNEVFKNFPLKETIELHIANISDTTSQYGVMNVLGQSYIAVANLQKIADINNRELVCLTPFPINKLLGGICEDSNGKVYLVKLDSITGKIVTKDIIENLDYDGWPADELVWLNDNTLIAILHARMAPEFKIISIQNGKAVVTKTGSMEKACLLYNKKTGGLELFQRTNATNLTRSIIDF